MKSIETGKEKVKKICDVLRKETIEPAEIEAEEIKGVARREAEEIIAKAKSTAEKMTEEARKEIARQQAVFQASLTQACRQTLDALKEKIETHFFNTELTAFLEKPLRDPSLAARLIETIVESIQKEGLDSDLSAYIASSVDPKSVAALIATNLLSRLKEKALLLSNIGGGVQVKLVDSGITIDLSDVALKELVAEYIRKDLRELVFSV